MGGVLFVPSAPGHIVNRLIYNCIKSMTKSGFPWRSRQGNLENKFVKECKQLNGTVFSHGILPMSPLDSAEFVFFC